MAASTFRPVRHLALAAALAYLSGACAPAWAQREAPSRTTQVQFQRGATEATYRGTLRGLAVHHYRFSARKGQVLNATLDSPSPHVEAVVYYIGRGGVAVNPVDDPLGLSGQTLPYSGRYEIRVLQTRNGARKGEAARPYALHIAITTSGAGLAAGAGVETTPELEKANWIAYRCDGGKPLKARYHYGEATARAQVLADGRSTTLTYGEGSNADMTVFEGGGLKWSIENLPPARRLQAKGGMLTRAETQVVSGQNMAVDNILRKGCDPVR
ncbi:hypothetical protein [Ottowia sp.]|uniref:hypothetical protein n=1 Tax=Ottowia sp. TaxID=1898956 RepID=UPI002C0AF090|nr:hypothetical protein [Ottowia sp.]HOB66156.1 hypothetical protein [Ottowia sp.]HPZ57390.1 hypothetical protein [Ottowia sp.]HQD47169.1 hypothetical protein [Ottowia sp.]